MPTVLQKASGWSSLRVGRMILIPTSLALAGMVLTGYSGDEGVLIEALPRASPIIFSRDWLSGPLLRP